MFCFQGLVYCLSIIVVAVSRPRQRVPDKLQENRPPPDPRTKLTSLRVAFALPLTLSASASACDGGCQDPENLSKLRNRPYMYNVASFIYCADIFIRRVLSVVLSELMLLLFKYRGI